MNYINRDMKHIKIRWFRKLWAILNQRGTP